MDRGNTATIRIEIDQELAEVVPGFLEGRHRDCILIEQMLAEDQLDGILSLAHRMKGTGGSYGFDEISEIGEALESAALVVNADGIRSAVGRLRQYLANVTVEYI